MTQAAARGPREGRRIGRPFSLEQNRGLLTVYHGARSLLSFAGLHALAVRDGQALERAAWWLQYESAEITSPPATDPRARQTMPSMLLLMNLTDPSPNKNVDPAGMPASGIDRRECRPAELFVEAI